MYDDRFTLKKIFGMARVKLARVPKKSSANFVYTKPCLPYQKYRTKIFEKLNILSKSRYNVDLILVMYYISAGQTKFKY